MNRHSTKTKRLKSSLRSKSFSDLDLKVQVKHVIKKIKVRNVGFLKSSNEIKVLDLQRLSHTLPFWISKFCGTHIKICHPEAKYNRTVFKTDSRRCVRRYNTYKWLKRSDGGPKTTWNFITTSYRLNKLEEFLRTAHLKTTGFTKVFEFQCIDQLLNSS